MKKLIKILPIVMVVLMIMTTVSPVLATSGTIGGVQIDVGKTGSTGGVTAIGNSILSIIRVVGIVIAVGVLMVLGIKYMMGSAEEKAEYKKTMLPYLIGAIILFAAVNIATYVVEIANVVGKQ